VVTVEGVNMDDEYWARKLANVALNGGLTIDKDTYVRILLTLLHMPDSAALSDEFQLEVWCKVWKREPASTMIVTGPGLKIEVKDGKKVIYGEETSPWEDIRTHLGMMSAQFPELGDQICILAVFKAYTRGHIDTGGSCLQCERMQRLIDEELINSL
jgi:hypothetical protein